MGDYPRAQPVVPSFISTQSYLMGAHHLALGAAASSFTSGAWTTANAGLYIPFVLPAPYLIQRLFWCNGSGTNDGTSDIGIYSPGGALIYSKGPTNNNTSSASTPIFVTPTSPVQLGPGRYFIAYSCSTTTASARLIRTASSIDVLRLMGCFQQASVATLPSSATFAAVSTLTVMPLVGFTNTTSGY